MDLEIREFREGLIIFINRFELPMEIKRLVVKEVYGDIDDAANGVIKKQAELRNQKEDEEVAENAESV